MDKKIYITETEGYLNASDEMKKHRLLKKGAGFDLSVLTNEAMATCISNVIWTRGKRLTPLSLRTEIYPFNQLCQFLNSVYPEVNTITEVPEAEMVRNAKIWLTKNGKKITQKRNRITSEHEEVIDAELIRYIKKIYKELEEDEDDFCFDKDKWKVDSIPLIIKKNPVKNVQTISFEKIPQPAIRNEVKRAIYHLLSTSALGTILAEITAINRFTGFIKRKYPDVDSLIYVRREQLCSYLMYINTEATGRKSYAKELYHLRTILETIGRIFEYEELEQIFYEDDIPNDQQFLYKVYSESEKRRLNDAIVNADPQIARVLMIHQLLGTRISETLTLRRDAIYQTDTGKWMICIKQTKTSRGYRKSINEDVLKLFKKACEWTEERYGETEYVFVTDSDPTKPMQYSRLQYQLMAIIAKNNLVDDNGEKFGVGTHIWRHCYGKRLTELHVDDAIIAKLLGHSNTSSLKHYRKVGNEMMSAETSKMRESMSDILDDIIREW